MAEPQKPQADSAPSGKKKLMILIGLIMALEGVGIFVAIRVFSGGAQSAAAGEGGTSDMPDGQTPVTAKDDIAMKGKMEEIKVADCRPSNKVTGKLITFQLSVSVLVSREDGEAAKELIAMYDGRLRDRVNFVFRSAEPEHINEAGLDTIKRRLKLEFDRVLEDSQIVKEVLIPEFLQSGSGL